MLYDGYTAVVLAVPVTSLSLASSSAAMMSPAQRLLVGACLFAGRSVSFHLPTVSTLSRQVRSLGVDGGSNLSSRRRPHSGIAMKAAAGTMQETIESRLTENLLPVHLEVINESHMHSGPAKESHFKVQNL